MGEKAATAGGGKLAGRRVLVVGFGRTGQAVVEFLLARDARVRVSEIKPREEMAQEIARWAPLGVEFECGGHREKSFLESDLIVVSPGVRPLPVLAAAARRGIEVISEIELAFRYLPGRMVGITGSNGKSTTTTLVYELLRDAGLPAKIAGNIGVPLIGFARDPAPDAVYVVELSSFQLKYVKRFRPHVAVFLNITPDHLDWHPDFGDYLACKSRIFARQRSGDFAVLNADDPHLAALREKMNARVLFFSTAREPEIGAFIRGGEIRVRLWEGEFSLPVSRIPLRGRHNLENVMAALLAASRFGVAEQSLRETVFRFKGLEHRLERVAEIGGVQFYNDSKATNVDAARKAIESFSEKIVLILGGRDKNGDFSLLRGPVRSRVRSLVLIGEARAKIAAALGDLVPCREAATLEDAVQCSFALARPGDVVLLAPACASFDMFRNYGHRGEVFKNAVLQLRAGHSGA